MKFTDATKKAVKLLNSKEFEERVQEEDPSMMKQIPLLKQINDLGFLTFDSQAGRHSKGISVFDKKPYEMKERAYMMGFMQEKKAIEFIKAMGIQTDKNAIYIPLCEDTMHIPRELDIPLTITIKNGDANVQTHMSAAMPKSSGTFLKKMVNLNKSEKAILVFCWDPIWNRLASGKKGLFTQIISVLKSI